MENSDDWSVETQNEHDEKVLHLDAKRAERSKRGAKINGGGGETVVVKQPAQAFSDEAMALAFAARHGPGLRYVALWGSWMSWDGAHWRSNSTLRAYDLARQIARETATTCNHKKTATQIASAKTVAAIEKLAKADRRVAATEDQWDCELDGLNTPMTEE